VSIAIKIVKLAAPAALFLLAACGAPALSSEECIAARPSVREFYGYHFGNDMSFTPETLTARERFLSAGFRERLKQVPGPGDPFTTGTEDVPRAFRVGDCTSDPEGRTKFEILIFWRDEDRTEQRTIIAEAVNENGTWLIDRVNY
jgi:hypothetical protein